MTWMKAGEFECENGCKAVVVGRLPNPVDGASAWYGYSVYKDSGRSMHAQWNDDGRCAGNRNYNLKPPTQVRYMAVGLIGGVSAWNHSLKNAIASVKDTSFVLAVDFVHGGIVNAQAMRVFIPNGPNAWKQMGLGELFITTILNPTETWSADMQKTAEQL